MTILLITMLCATLAGWVITQNPTFATQPNPVAVPGATRSPERPPGIENIRHVIWIIQENRSFDNYFGTFPAADGFPPGVCLPMLPGSKKCIAPFHMPKGAPPCDMSHDWHIAHCRLSDTRADTTFLDTQAGPVYPES